MTEQHERYANELEKALNKFSENVNKILEEMFSFESETEKDWELKYPYKNDDEYFILFDDGDIDFSYCDGDLEDINRFKFGNVFPNREAAKLEAERRLLLTRFKAFRDECNGNWKPNFTIHDNKYFIEKRSGKIDVNYICTVNAFILFGYFKNYEDAERAIKLFGDEIKKLFIDCECD